jgi:hypothetical protein
VGVPLEELACLVQPIYGRLGIRTGKEQIRAVAAPASRLIVRAMCSLAAHGQVLRGVTQAADGCLLEATLPSDLFSFEGKLLVSIRRKGPARDGSVWYHAHCQTAIRLGQEQAVSGSAFYRAAARGGLMDSSVRRGSAVRT